MSITSSENQRPTCVQSKRPKPNVPAPTRRRNRPTSMMKNRIISVASDIGMLYLQLSVLSTLQVFDTGSHEERSYVQIRLVCPSSRTIQTNYSPAQYLGGPNHIRSNSRQLKIRLAMNKESNIDPPYAHCDGRNYLVSVPNGNPGSTHGFVIFRSQIMEGVRAERK